MAASHQAGCKFAAPATDAHARNRAYPELQLRAQLRRWRPYGRRRQTAVAANRKLNLRLGKEYCKEDRHVSLASLSHSVRDQHLGVACRIEQQVREVRRSQLRAVCRMG